MFDDRLFWKLVEEKGAELGATVGLRSVVERDIIDRGIVNVLLAPQDSDLRWDDRRWRYPFEVRALMAIVERSVPPHAFARPSAAMMELALHYLVTGEGHRVAMEPDGNPHEHGMIKEALGFRVPTLEEAILIVKSILLP